MKLIDWINIVLVITVPYSLWLEFRTNKRLREENKELLGRLEHMCSFCDKTDSYGMGEGVHGPRGLICKACAQAVSDIFKEYDDELRRSEE